ncbi:MAG: hypothetical protein IT367_03895, partial [Candidatus Hydrogenedentes bacterium]|nr:hypothetical protein [Candidatus Hydrogenedentota bacterium]
MRNNISSAAAWIFAAFVVVSVNGLAQTAQVGADPNAGITQKLRVEYAHYRPAKWETTKVIEYESEHPNEGGLLYFYITNTSDQPVNLRYWRFNNRDESYWILN